MSDSYYAVGTLRLKVHRNGELTLSENTVFPIRIPGSELLGNSKKPKKKDADKKVLDSVVLDFLRNKYRSVNFTVNDLAEISVDTTRNMMERLASKIAGVKLWNTIEAETLKRFSLEKNRDKNLHDSLMRSKKNLIDYAFNNQWSHFATFTVNSERCDRYSLAECNKKIGTVLNQFRRYHCPDFKYLIIPEKHEDGAFHYHGFVVLPEDIEFTECYVKRKLQKTLDFFTYALGFNSFSSIKNQVKAAKYITKYIEKQTKEGHMRNIREQIADAKLLMHSRGLRKPSVFFFRKEALPEAIHRPVDPETGEVRPSFQKWGNCRTQKDIEQLCDSIVSDYAIDGYEIFGVILGNLSLLRQKGYFDIKI